MGSGIIFDIHSDNYAVLRKLNIVECESASWGPTSRNSQALLGFFRSASSLLAADTLVDVAIPIAASGKSTEDFFAILFQNLPAITSGLNLLDDLQFIVINLMPFHLSITIADKISAGIAASENKAEALGRIPVVLLSRNADWFVKSHGFKQLTAQKRCYIIIDIRGVVVCYKDAKTIELPMLSREHFQKVLAFQGEDFYKTLIYETNLFLGHFELSHSHVRTHYDLTDFVKRDNVSEHIFAEFYSFVSGYERICVVAIGMEASVLARLGFYFQSMLPDRVRYFDHIPDVSLIDETVSQAETSDVIVLLTDIVNSGETLKAVARTFRKRFPANPKLKLFSLVRMQNSPQMIDGLTLHSTIQIRRGYYGRDNDSCPLCAVKQPLHPVKRAEDFHYIDSNQLTPYDFWEMAADSKALHCRNIDSQGRKLEFRVKTESVLKRYRHWIKTLVRFKCQSLWPDLDPRIILTVDESSSKLFASVITEALGLEPNTVRVVSRESLRTATPSAGPIAESNVLRDSQEPVVVVDDGTNTGRTIAALIDYCRSARINPMGAIVFDNRLSLEQTRQLELKMGGSKLLSLYTWPSQAVQSI